MKEKIGMKQKKKETRERKIELGLKISPIEKQTETAKSERKPLFVSGTQQRRQMRKSRIEKGRNVCVQGTWGIVFGLVEFSILGGNFIYLIN